MKAKIGIVTLYKDNYGSILQCFATSEMIRTMGYLPVVLDEKVEFQSDKHKQMLKEALRHPLYAADFYKIRKNAGKKFREYQNNKNIELMNDFIDQYLNVAFLSEPELYEIGKSNEYLTFLSGSDQIWSGHAFPVNEMFFLRFAPKCKRIAWVPSFGTQDIAKYNKDRYQKYISEYNCLSVREQNGVDIIKNLTSRDSICLIDPVFMLSKTEWESYIHERFKIPGHKYIVCYFLDFPRLEIIKKIAEYTRQNNLNVVILGDDYREYDVFDKYENVKVDPFGFLNFIDSAEIIFTDSFHAVAFSVILHKVFYVYRRNYALSDQNSRVASILKFINMEEMYEPDTIMGNERTYNFAYADRYIDEKKREAILYLTNSFSQSAIFRDDD
ncbi:MAG: polysaccharide pyruvyl transferase family protein [Clostridiales bacterium]|nr:polysaccharide pyruvyl transferase family protein [Clostridiales bacterium]